MPLEGRRIEPAAIANFLRSLPDTGMSRSLDRARIADVLLHGFPYAQNPIVEQEKRLEQSEENHQRIIKEKHARRSYPPGTLRSTGYATKPMMSFMKGCRRSQESPARYIRHLLLAAVIRQDTLNEATNIPLLYLEKHLADVPHDEILKFYRRCIKEFIRKKWIEHVS